MTAAADGDVRLIDLVQERDLPLRPRVELLSSSEGDMTLKIEFLPLSPLSFLTTHQDGTIRLTDLRNARRTGTAGDAPEQTVVEQPESMFYSIAFDPTNPHTFAASSASHFVRLYDLRMAGRPYDAGPTNGGAVKMWVDPTLLPRGQPIGDVRRETRRHVTDVQFNSKGALLCNYSDHDLILFDSDDGELIQGIISTNVQMRFQGRSNVETFLKEARFLGQEEYVCTGSDSGDVFIWQIESGDLVHRVAGDTAIVNGVEPHPWLPTLAVCGIDSSVKIFEYVNGSGRGWTETDPIKSRVNAGQHFMPFHARTRTRPVPVAADEECVRLESAEELKQEGNAHYRSRRFGEASNCYNRALLHLNYCPPTQSGRENRDSVRKIVYLNRSAVHLATGDFEQAEQTARRALDLDSNAIKGWHRLARAYEGLGDLQNGIEALEQGLQVLKDADSRQDDMLEPMQKLLKKLRHNLELEEEESSS